METTPLFAAETETGHPGLSQPTTTNCAWGQVIAERARNRHRMASEKWPLLSLQRWSARYGWRARAGTHHAALAERKARV